MVAGERLPDFSAAAGYNAVSMISKPTHQHDPGPAGTRRHFLRTALAAPAILRGAQSRMPNVVIVISDDLTWNACEPYGSKDVKTPHMAELARQGMCFDRMFTSTAMCSPTRAQLYTGMYPVRNGTYPNHADCYDGVKSAVHHFRDLGYRAGIAGKTDTRPQSSFPFEIIDTAEPKPATGMDKIRQFVNRDHRQPYFMVVASNQPHQPRDVGDASQYPPAKLTVPPDLVDCPYTRQELSKYYAEITYLDQQVGGVMDIVNSAGDADNTIFIFTSEQGGQFPFAKWTCYEQGLKTGCIVRWPGKVRAGSRNRALTQYVDVLPTLLEAAGGHPEKIDCGRPDAMGRRGFDGRSFLPVLTGKSNHFRDYVYGVHTTHGIINGNNCYPIRSIRSSRYKYIVNLNNEEKFSCVLTNEKQDGMIVQWQEWGKTHPEAARRTNAFLQRPREEFYDVETDPYELKNLAGESRHASTVADLKRRLDEFMKQQGDQGVQTELASGSRLHRAAGKKK